MTPKVRVLRLVVRPVDLGHDGREFRHLFGLEVYVLARLAGVGVDARLLPDLRGRRLCSGDTARAKRVSDHESLPLVESRLRAEREDDVSHRPSVSETVASVRRH